MDGEKYLSEREEIVGAVPYLSNPEVNDDFVRGRGKYGEKVVFGTGRLLKSFGVYNLEDGTNASLYASQILKGLKLKSIEKPEAPERLSYPSAG